MTHPMTASLYPADYEPVPTIAELARQGLAQPVKVSLIDSRDRSVKTSNRMRVSPKGQALIDAAMKRNAARGRAFDEQRRAERAAA